MFVNGWQEVRLEAELLAVFLSAVAENSRRIGELAAAPGSVMWMIDLTECLGIGRSPTLLAGDFETSAFLEDWQQMLQKLARVMSVVFAIVV